MYLFIYFLELQAEITRAFDYLSLLNDTESIKTNLYLNGITR